ncbi:uncharacterized protein LOC125228651 [Leguminivora glycinivorella]|uniref:uncharacterized protein LOC125228651 n=1 Tax=Leguminivora glycinivorella TaxID=1035111 RepID=UPI00200E7380|nr:uncharacterized protein LOC125228651 [Leguminivora glycinivorella]
MKEKPEKPITFYSEFPFSQTVLNLCYAVNSHLKSKVKEAENEIIAIGQAQKLVVDRLRRELELYQQRLKARNKQTNIENDNRYVAQQLRDHQLQYRSRNRTVSLLKPSVLNEIHIKSENYNDVKENISDSETEIKSTNEKENSNHSDAEEKDKYLRNYQQIPKVHDSRNNFANALNKVKEAFIGNTEHGRSWQERSRRSESESPPGPAELSPTPSPPPLPAHGEPVSQELFLRLIGLVTPAQKEVLEKKRSERRKRSTTSTNRNDFVYGSYEMLPKRKKYNQFPYLQSHNDPPQTRSAKLRKQQFQTQSKESREESPSGSSGESKAAWSGGGGGNSAPAWAARLPAGLSVEPLFAPSAKKVCTACGRNDVPSLLVWCGACGVWLHTGCGAAGRCGCGAALPDPAARASLRDQDRDHHQLVRDKLAERKRLQEKNIQLCVELRKLEARAATLKENLDDHNAEKRQLLADQIKTQRNLQKLLDFISQFKETSISIRSTSASESGSEVSKSNEE